MPPQNQLNVPVPTSIFAAFETDMDEATINSSSFLVYGSNTGLRSGTITYDGSNNTAKFDPDDDFAVGEIATVVLTAEIQTSGATPLDNSFIWSFTEAVDGGHGALGPPNHHYATGYPSDMMAADFTGDGYPDIALICTSIDEDSIVILANDGSGNVTPYGVHPVGFKGGATSKPAGMAADFDGDGDVDLAVVNSFADADSIAILANDGSGNVTPYGVHPVGFKGSSTGKPAGMVADFDGDGDIDVAVVNSFADTDSIAIMTNDGSGNVTPYGVHPVGFKGSSTGKPAGIAADFTGDGSIDIAVICSFADGDSIVILENDGSGDMTPYGVHPVGFKGSSTGKPAGIAADFTGDGSMDIAVVCSFVDGDSIVILENDGDGDMTPYGTGVYPVGFQGGASGKPTIVAADFDGDGDIDIAVTNAFENCDSIAILENDGNGDMTPYGTGVYPVGFQGGASGKPSSIAADFDGDGDMDIAAANSDVDAVAILFNEPCDCGVWGDVNGDGNINPVDVVYMVQYAYLSNDMRVQPPNCQYGAGDVNCDGQINPVDVVYYVQYAYLSNNMFCSDPCF